MKNIVTLGICLAVSSSSPRTIAVPKVMAKYAPHGYIHPIAVSSVRERRGDKTTAFRWMAVYRSNLQHPQVKKAIERYRGTADDGMRNPGVLAYDRQLTAAGIKVESRMSGMTFSYIIQDRQGKKLQVVVRGDRDYHAPESGEFSVFVSSPGG